MTLRNRIYKSAVLSGRLRRYHGWPTLHIQTVGEHSARVANIYVELFGMPRSEVLYYILNHDAGELLAGDVPFGGKDKVAGLREAIHEAEEAGLEMLGIKLPWLSAQEHVQVKISDLLEMHEFGRIEEMMGNELAAPITQDTMTAALKLAEEKCLTHLVEAWIEQQEHRI